jgi:hypothetical protein
MLQETGRVSVNIRQSYPIENHAARALSILKRAV